MIRSFSDTCHGYTKSGLRGKISRLLNITIDFRRLWEPNFKFGNDYGRFLTPAEAPFCVFWWLQMFSGTCKSSFCIYWRLRLVFGDWGRSILSLTMSTIVLWHLWKLKFTDDNNHFLLNFEFTTIATNFDRKIPEPRYKFNVNLWLGKDFHNPSLKFRTFRGLLWLVDTLKMQRQIGGKQIFFLYVLK